MIVLSTDVEEQGSTRVASEETFSFVGRSACRSQRLIQEQALQQRISLSPTLPLEDHKHPALPQPSQTTNQLMPEHPGILSLWKLPCGSQSPI